MNDKARDEKSQPEMLELLKKVLSWIANLLGLRSQKETPPDGDISTMPRDELTKKMGQYLEKKKKNRT